MTTHDAPTIVDLYVRLSDLRMEDLNADGEAKGLVEHERVLRERADAHRWTVGEVIVENDMTGGKPKPASAYKRRKVVTPGRCRDRCGSPMAAPTRRSRWRGSW